MSLRDTILAARVPTTVVEVPDWGVSVHIRALSVRARVALLDAVYANEAAHTAWTEDQAKPEDEREGLERVDIYDQAILSVIFGIVDEDGNPVFTVADYDRFTDMDYSVIVNLWMAMKKHEVRDPENVKKNSASTRKGGSSSASRSRSAKQ